MKYTNLKTLGLSLAFAAVAAVAQPQQVLAKDIGIDIAKQIINGFAHKGIASIFGMMGSDELTPDKLNDVLDAGFKSYEQDEVADAVWALRYNVATYNPLMTHDTRTEIINQITTDAEKVLNAVGTNVTDPKSFWKLMPAYMYAKNVQLTFLAEQHTMTNMASLKIVTAEHAANGLHHVRLFFEQHFRDETPYRCLAWDPNQPTTWLLRLPNSHKPSPAAYAAKKAVRCMPKGHTLFDKGSVHIPALEEKTVYKDRGQNRWFFVYKRYADKDEYWVRGYETESIAQRNRFRLSMDNYPETLGPMSTQLKNWYEIINTLDKPNVMQHAQQIQQAYQDMIVLGLIDPLHELGPR